MTWRVMSVSFLKQGFCWWFEKVDFCIYLIYRIAKASLNFKLEVQNSKFPVSLLPKLSKGQMLCTPYSHSWAYMLFWHAFVYFLSLVCTCKLMVGVKHVICFGSMSSWHYIVKRLVIYLRVWVSLIVFSAILLLYFLPQCLKSNIYSILYRLHTYNWQSFYKNNCDVPVHL